MMSLYRNRTIYKDLIASLSLIVIITITIVSFFNFMAVSNVEKAELEKKADEYANYISNSLSLAINMLYWTFMALYLEFW